MKKTIIAAAIAASVAAPAFAEVSISGMMNPEWVKEGSDYDVSAATVNSTTAAAGTGVNTDLVITSSEDLGNGLKAGVKYHIFHDHANSQVADLSASLSGDFGTIIAGR
jgi:predicted porin